MKQLEDNKTPDMFGAPSKKAKVNEGIDDRIDRLVTAHARYINSFFTISPWRGNNKWSSKSQPTKEYSVTEKDELIRKHLVMTTNKIKGQFK